jgi:diguanylate cyclase (GGDEF)-like protein
VPVRSADGSLFGTLCAIHPDPQDPAIVNDLPLFNMFGTMIEKLIEYERRIQAAGKDALASRLDQLKDPMTGFPDRIAWEEALEKEELRVQRLQEPVAVVILDLEDLTSTNATVGRAIGDSLLRQFANALRDCLPTWALPFRLGGEEFAILLQNTDPSTAREFLTLIRTKMEKEMISVSTGIAMRNPKKGLAEAWELALLEMYSDKQRNRDKLAA